MSDPRRSLPGVDAVLADPALSNSLATLPRSVVVAAIREALDEARVHVASGQAVGGGVGAADRTAQVAARAAALATSHASPTLRPVVNATGVILHTNLGRAPLATSAIERMASAARGYTNLEFDLDGGVRGSRYTHCARLICELTGAEDALVVNNCAAALILALNTVARGKDVVVSRGELIEIGGGFRIPEIVERAGTNLIEVGTTNRTRLEDYRTAVGSETGALLKVHRSNFRIEGFSEEAELSALRGLAQDVHLPLVYDLGSGLMLPLETPDLPAEPTVPEAIAAGAELVVFSGDKLLGGPQVGVIAGTREWVARTRKNPLTRALRVDVLTLSSLEATLELYREPARARREIPTLRMIHEDPEALRDRAERMAAEITASLGEETEAQVTAISTRSVVGGGTLPGAEIASWGVRVVAPAGATELARKLREGAGETRCVVARVHEQAVILDLRTVETKQDGDLGRTLAVLLR